MAVQILNNFQPRVNLSTLYDPAAAIARACPHMQQAEPAKMWRELKQVAATLADFGITKHVTETNQTRDAAVPQIVNEYDIKYSDETIACAGGLHINHRMTQDSGYSPWAANDAVTTENNLLKATLEIEKKTPQGRYLKNLSPTCWSRKGSAAARRRQDLSITAINWSTTHVAQFINLGRKTADKQITAAMLTKHEKRIQYITSHVMAGSGRVPPKRLLGYEYPWAYWQDAHQPRNMPIIASEAYRGPASDEQVDRRSGEWMEKTQKNLNGQDFDADLLAQSVRITIKTAPFEVVINVMQAVPAAIERTFMLG